MAISNVLVESTQTTQIFAVPANQEYAVTTMFFCNQSATQDTILDIYLVPNGQALSASTQIIKSLPLPKTETFVFDAEKLILENGDALWAEANVDKIVVATISSVKTS
jgi:hypothetical protein